VRREFQGDDMTTPAGWYDDGSGRQRWWDGQQWTEHFAPEAAAPSQPEAPAEPEGFSDAVPPVPPIPQSDASGYPGAAAPTYPVTPGAYGSAPGAYAGGGYPAAAPYGATEPTGPKKMSVLGLVGLGLAVLGTILVLIPAIGFIGFFVLAAAFIVSLISLFLKGKKWPGITGLSLSIVGTIIGVIMTFIYLVAFAAAVNDEVGDLPSSAPSISAEPSETSAPDAGSGTGRPTVEEVAVGIESIIQSTGSEGYTEENITCFAEEFVASDIDDETLRVIATGEDATFSDEDAAVAFADQFADSLATCLIP
jgi:hypothetical protein